MVSGSRILDTYPQSKPTILTSANIYTTSTPYYPKRDTRPSSEMRVRRMLPSIRLSYFFFSALGLTMLSLANIVLFGYADVDQLGCPCPFLVIRYAAE